MTNVVDCDIDGRNDEIVSLDYLDNIHEVQGNFPDLKNPRGESHEMENGFAGMVNNLLMDTNLNQSYFQGPTENNVQGKMKFRIIFYVVYIFIVFTVSIFKNNISYYLMYPSKIVEKG